MGDKAFIDTNVFVYLSSEDDPDKRQAAMDALEAYDCVVSTQVVNELCNVLLKKYGKSASEIKATIEAMEAVCNVALITVVTTDKALDIHERYRYSFYDSLILAAALESGCQYVIS
ncbi:MAG: PIN domain-containing protein, partial [Candidatus Accumulibacter sp.]|nr:PIN domain-containing protein [Accumulibacter sp.]